MNARTLGNLFFLMLICLLPFGCQEKTNWPEFKSGDYTLQAKLDPDPPIVGENALELRILGPDGNRIKGAQVNLRAYMPAMGAMPAMEAKGTATDSGDGTYRPTFNVAMSGNWELTVRFEKNGKELARFILLIAPPRPGITDPDAGSNTGGEMKGEQHLRVSLARQQLIGVRTAEVKERALTRSIRTVGRVEVDETRLWHVSLKFGGWIEKLFVDFTNAFVNKGDPLFTLYSEELLVSQQEYLDALEAREAGGSQTLVRAARDRLKLWDLTDAQIREIARRGTANKYLTVYSPATGYVVEKQAVEGHRVEPGKRLYEIADLSSVWVIADLYEYEAALIEKGQQVSVENPYRRGKVREGKVDYIYPRIDLRTRTLPVRLVFENDNLVLKPGMFVDVAVDVPLGRQIAIPFDAVLYSGEHRYVFVDHGRGNLEPREIQLGQRADDYYVVLSGLKAGERVVSSGNFLISSEAQLKSALPKWDGAAEMVPGNGGDGRDHPQMNHEDHQVPAKNDATSEDPGMDGGHEGHEMPGTERMDNDAHEGHDEDRGHGQ